MTDEKAAVKSEAVSGGAGIPPTGTSGVTASSPNGSASTTSIEKPVEAAANVKKERKAKALAPYVVGVWQDDGSFKPMLHQPAKPITGLVEMVAWVCEKYEGIAGKFEFVRREPRRLVLAQQVTMKGILEG
jgi:hypothetical protein